MLILDVEISITISIVLFHANVPLLISINTTVPLSRNSTVSATFYCLYPLPKTPIQIYFHRHFFLPLPFCSSSWNLPTNTAKTPSTHTHAQQALTNSRKPPNMGCTHSHQPRDRFQGGAKTNPFVRPPPPFTEDVVRLPPKCLTRRVRHPINPIPMPRIEDYGGREYEGMNDRPYYGNVRTDKDMDYEAARNVRVSRIGLAF